MPIKWALSSVTKAEICHKLELCLINEKEIFKMNEFQNDLQQLSVSQFQTGDMTPWNQQSQYPVGQYPIGVNPADPSRLCVGFCGGGFFGGGFCGGFGGGFCGGFGGGFCGGFGGGFCGGFCGGFGGGMRCGGFHCR
ncbi:heterocycloanthracin/sonorensin family bacteriocin [Paenibacillus foliorum]|nr:heterocycloanthracin/sonorensin family bacteriocin [Paenibacillus foliorum]